MVVTSIHNLSVHAQVWCGKFQGSVVAAKTVLAEESEQEIVAMRALYQNDFVPVLLAFKVCLAC